MGLTSEWIPPIPLILCIASRIKHRQVTILGGDFCVYYPYIVLEVPVRIARIRFLWRYPLGLQSREKPGKSIYLDLHSIHNFGTTKTIEMSDC